MGHYRSEMISDAEHQKDLERHKALELIKDVQLEDITLCSTVGELVSIIDFIRSPSTKSPDLTINALKRIGIWPEEAQG